MLARDWPQEIKIYLNKLILDCKRYIVESKIYHEEATGEEIEKEKRDLDRAYGSLIDQADAKDDKGLPYHNPIKLGLINNAALYRAEVMGNREGAYIVAKKTSDIGKGQLSEVEGAEYSEAQAMLQLIDENLRSWEGNKPAN